MFLVDGYNAIRRIPSLLNAEKGAGLAAGRRALVATLVASGILRSSRVIVVFDSAEGGAGPPDPSPHRMLSLRYSTPPQDADGAIVSLLEGAIARRAGVAIKGTVVTADRELSWQVRRLGARVVLPEEWAPLRMKRVRGRVGRKAREAREAREARSEKPQASSAEVDYWLGVFGGGEKDEKDEG